MNPRAFIQVCLLAGSAFGPALSTVQAADGLTGSASAQWSASILGVSPADTPHGKQEASFTYPAQPPLASVKVNSGSDLTADAFASATVDNFARPLLHGAANAAVTVLGSLTNYLGAGASCQMNFDATLTCIPTYRQVTAPDQSIVRAVELIGTLSGKIRKDAAHAIAPEFGGGYVVSIGDNVAHKGTNFGYSKGPQRTASRRRLSYSSPREAAASRCTGLRWAPICKAVQRSPTQPGRMSAARNKPTKSPCP